jgi:hypothetical protein
MKTQAHEPNCIKRDKGCTDDADYPALKGHAPVVVLVILEGDGNVGAIAGVDGAQPAAGLQDDVFGEGDVEAAVALDPNRPEVIGEVNLHAARAQAVAVRVCDQPAGAKTISASLSVIKASNML